MKRIFRFRSRVSRRIFLVILLSSLVPIACLAGLTYYNVRTKLIDETANRLRHVSKNIGMAVIIEFTEAEEFLKQKAQAQHLSTTATPPLVAIEALPGDPFLTIWFVAPDKAKEQDTFPVSDEIFEHLLQGNSQLMVVPNSAGVPGILMLTPGFDDDNRPIIMAGLINHDSLLPYIQALLPPNAHASLVDEHLKPLYDLEFEPQVSLDLMRDTQQPPYLYVEIETDTDTWLVGSWSVYLQQHFNAPSWNVLVCEPKNIAFASLFRFTRNAGTTCLLTVWIILLASSVLVRKTLSPLLLLHKATQQVGKGDYGCRVDIRSQDEFEELSTSFNQMADKISQQLSHQEHMGKTIREVLGTIEQKEIVHNLFKGLAGLVDAELVSFVLIETELGPNGKIWLACPQQNQGHIQYTELQIDPAQFALQQPAEDYRWYSCTVDSPPFFQPLVAKGSKHLLLFTVVVSPRLQGIISFAYPEPIVKEEEVATLRQLADQLGVALGKAVMVEELDSLNFGIMTALARTVDANSKWTRGHSERVTQHALAIATEMGLDNATLVEVHRAGLLHDLGKIAVSGEILNKPGKLTDEEYMIVKKHPSEGARILEPIRAFDGIRPAVEQHHERWDGFGYPGQLKGEEIHPIARILSVADVYDALYSDRPYRKGWNQDRVLSYLTEESGKAFEPKIVQALLKVIEKTEALSA
jgi:putative nucleotidyltransferase with HDIG domain